MIEDFSNILLFVLAFLKLSCYCKLVYKHTKLMLSGFRHVDSRTVHEAFSESLFFVNNCMVIAMINKISIQ